MADGGYETARRVLTEMKPEEVVEQVKASGIRGRGGAGFPTGQKWSFLAPAFPRYLVVNADESEPGTFKDRMIMEYDPHQLIEGIILSVVRDPGELAFIYIRGEYYFGYTRLVEAIEEAKAKGFLGKGIFGSDTQPGDRRAPRRGRLRVRRRDCAAHQPGGLSAATRA